MNDWANFNSRFTIVWLGEHNQIKNWHDTYYPIVFTECYGGVRGYCSGFTGTPTLNCISFGGIFTNHCNWYSDANIPYNYAILWGII